MFNDQRSKRVVFAAHCILNQNAISDGTLDYPAALSGAFLPGAGPGRPAGSGAPGVGGEHPHPAGHPAAARGPADGGAGPPGDPSDIGVPPERL